MSGAVRRHVVCKSHHSAIIGQDVFASLLKQSYSTSKLVATLQAGGQAAVDALDMLSHHWHITVQYITCSKPVPAPLTGAL